MDKLIAQMNDILSDWKENFDLLSQVRLVFSMDTHMALCLNDIQLCPATSMDLDHAAYDTEQISFFFADQSQIQITITWPEDAVPFVSCAQFISSQDIN